MIFKEICYKFVCDASSMLIPIRCFTCGKPIAQLWNKYQDLLKKGTEIPYALDQVGLKRRCCRRMFVSQVDIIDTILPYHSET